MVTKFAIVATVIGAIATGAEGKKDSPGLVGKVNLPYKPAFLKIWKDHLYVSTFFNNNRYSSIERFADQPDAVHRIPVDLSDKASDYRGSFSAEDSINITPNGAVWPNEIGPAPEGAMGPNDCVNIPGGFIVPDTKGAIWLSYPNDNVSYRISPDFKEWFYHRAIWVDLDGDDKLDLITLRSSFGVPPLFASKSQLVWLRNNGQTLANTPGGKNNIDLFNPWDVIVIDDGTQFGSGDVHLFFQDMDGDGKDEIVATHFFDHSGVIGFKKDNPSMVIYSTTEASWGTAQYPKNVKRTLFAKGVGGMFDAEYVDLNMDGKMDMLVTNHESKGEKGLVLAYEQPATGGYQNEKGWTKHVLHEGFVNRVPEGMSPGAAHTFHPKQSMKGSKPWIVTSGDGSGRAHLYVPYSEDSDDWQYLEVILLDTELELGEPTTTGAIAIYEVPENECTLIYVPAFETGDVFVFDGCKLVQEFERPALAEKPSDDDENTRRNNAAIWAAFAAGGIGVGLGACIGYYASIKLRENKRKVVVGGNSTHDRAAKVSFDGQQA